MTKKEKDDFLRYINEMMRRGWRAYVIDDIEDFEEMASLNNIRIESYEFSKVVLARDENHNRIPSSQQREL